MERTGDGSYEWHTGFHLPRPLAYGASVSTERGVLCIGGCDAEQCYPEAFLLRWNLETKQVDLEPLPSLPFPLAFASAARMGNTVFIAGGQPDMQEAAATSTFLSLDFMTGNSWESLPTWRRPARILPSWRRNTAASRIRRTSSAGATRLRAGNRIASRRLCLRPFPRAWTRLSDTPRCLMAGSGASFGASHILLLGGDDGRYWNQDLRDEHPGFPKTFVTPTIP